jgi:pimeloyl-ACP methyl ester carboxylesterase
VDNKALRSIWLELLGTEFRQHFCDANGFRTRIVEAGTGDDLVVLLHGTGGHAETYQRNIAALARDFRVLAIDMIGHGFSDRPDVDYSLDDFAEHVIGLLDACEVERAHISGESLGAMVAAWTAIRFPDRVNRIVMNTGILARPDKQGLAELADFRDRTLALRNDLSLETVRHRMEWLVHDPKTMSDETVAARFRIYSQPGMVDTVIKVMSQVVGMIHGDYRVDYFEPGVMNQIECPTLVLWTPHNPGQSLALAQSTVGEIPSHDFRVLDGCAHWPQYENSEVFNEVHREFLNG